MGAVTDHHVKEDHGYFRIFGFFIQPADAQLVIHHRVQSTDGELIFAEVYNTMFLADEGIRQLEFFIDGGVCQHARNITVEDMLGFVSECTAREQTAQIFLLRSEFFDRQISITGQFGGIVGQFHSQTCCVIQTGGKEEVAVAQRGNGAGDKVHHNRFSGFAGDLEHFFSDLG